MKVLLVFLVFSFFCFSSNAQLLDEGSTTTTVIESQGGVEEVTETTTTIEHKNTGDVLDGDTGIVTNKYEGDEDVDWGGAGAIYSHSSCTDAASGFHATGTDGRTSACGHAKNNSLTTWRQYVDLNSFDIKDGGEVNYEFLFAFPNSMYTNANRTAFMQTKGYNDNTLQWETGLVTIDKTTFTQNPNNYNNNTNWVNTVTGSYDFANQLDKVYIEIGGYGTYYWDEFQYTVAYNQISTVVETWLQLVVQQQDLDIIIDITDNYDLIDNNIIIDAPIIDNYTSDPPIVDNYTDDPPITEYTMDSGITELDMPLDIPMLEISPNQYEEIIVELDTSLEEASNTIEAPVVVDNLPKEPPAIENTPKEPVNEEIKEPINAPAEPVEEVEDSKPTPETASNEEVVEEVKEEPKQEVVEKEVEKESVEEKVEEKTETKVAEKTEEQKTEEKKEQRSEKRQAKAKEIMNKFESNYDAVAQITTLALVNALGPNIKTYSNQVIQPSLQWYETEEIYTDVVMQDPLGNYFGVRDSLVFEQMIGSQYNE